MRRLVKLLTASALTIILSTSSILPAIGGTPEELQQKQQELQQKIEETSQALSQKKAEESAAVKELKQLNNVLSTTEKQLKNTESKLAATEQELKQIEAEIVQTEDKLNTNFNILGERLKTMYVQGDVHILEVLLNSASITDFLTRWDLFCRIADSNTQLIEGIKDELTKYQEQQKLVSQKKEMLASLKEEQSTKKKELAVATSRQQTLVKQIQQDKASIEAMLNELEAESARIEAELKKLLSGDDTVYGTGKMIWPAPGYSRITSQYGMRRHPILKVNKMHTGIDIGAPQGAKVIAADDGKVIEAGWRGSYGQVVMINHGNGIVTLYAHLSAYMVKAGDIVVKGQKIAEVGSTGMSTGPHLHFEVRKNGSTVNPLNYVKYK